MTRALLLMTAAQANPAALNPGPGKLVILTYHDMIEARGKDALWFDCTPKELEAQIIAFRKAGCQFVNLDTVYNHLVNKAKVPSKSVCFTFADGYMGFKKLAWPILQKYKVPVTMFAHTGRIGDTSGRPKMGWSDYKELLRSPLFRVQSQTVSHPENVGRLSSPQLKAELTDSKSALESKLGIKVLDFAYPNGKFTPRAIQQVRASGYRMAFSEEWGLAEGSSNRFLVRRYVHTAYQKAILALK